MTFLQHTVRLFVTLLIAIAICFTTTTSAFAIEHPHVLYNQLEISDLKSRIKSQEEPLFSHYKSLKTLANTYRTGNHLYTGSDPKYFREGLDIDGPIMFSHAMLYSIDKNQDNARFARELLINWSSSLSQVNHYNDFSDASNNKEAAAMFLGRAMYQVVPAYDLIYDSGVLSAQDKTQIDTWLRKVATLITEGMDSWFNTDSTMPCHNYSNHVSAHLSGLILIGYMLESDALVTNTISGETFPTNWKKFLSQSIYMAGDPVIGCDKGENLPTFTGEIVDRYRHLDHPGSDPNLKLNRGLGYSLLSTYNLALGAEAALHHGVDLFHYQPDSGENLTLPGIYYAHYLKNFGPGDTLIASTGYSGESLYVNEILQTDFIKPYELLTYRYHNNRKLAIAFSKYFLPSRKTLNNDYLFGKLYQYDQVRWEFFLNNITEGWATPTNIISGGTLQITTRDTTTTLTSPPLYLLASDYPVLYLRMKANGGGTHQGTITWNGASSLNFDVLADGQFHEYVVHLTEPSGWTGTITQLAIKPIDIVSSTVNIDWIRLQKDFPPTIKPGDLNNDNLVNIYDYNKLITGYGREYDISDFNDVVSNFGK